MTPLHRVDVRHLDGMAVLVLGGELDVMAVPELREAVRALSYRYDAEQIEIDCFEVEFMDMIVLGQLVTLANRVGGAPRLRGISPAVARVLALTDVADRFTLVTVTEGSAAQPLTRT